jgi:hypothetical protein
MAFSRCRTDWIYFFLIVMFFFSAAGCGGGESADWVQTADNGGALSVELDLSTKSDRLPEDDNRASAFEPDICRDHRIDTIQFDVLRNSDNATVGSMDFSCSAHHGTIANLPCETELNVHVTGMVADRPDWFFRAGGIVLLKEEYRILTVELIYVGEDSTPPELTEIQPSDGAVEIQVSSSICAVFSEPLALSSIPDQFITAAAADTPIGGSLSYDDARNAVCFTPVSQFDTATIYTAQLNGEVQDTASNSLTLKRSWQFTTGSGSGPYYTISASSGSGGTISPSGAVTVGQGADQSFSMTADAGYYLSGLVVDGAAVSPQSTYTFSNVTSGHTIAASFAILPQYSLSVTKTGSGSGTVSSSPAGISCGDTCNSSYTQGTQVSLTAAADAGSTFTGWSGGGCSGTGSCTVTMDGAVSVSAGFAAGTYTITATASAGGSISPQGRVIVNYGADQVFTISPASGFYLSNLYVDGSDVGPAETVSFRAVNKDHTIEAYFAFRTTLLHRWRFNGDLVDSIGGTSATPIDPDNSSATGDWVLSNDSITLEGGSHDEAAYISLGANLLPDNDFTIEVWATHLSVGRWDQIWYFGTGGQYACLMMYWNTKNDILTDLVEFRDGWLGVRYYEYDSYCPLLLNTEYHIVMVAETGDIIGGTELRWYVATSSSPTLGDAKEDINIPITPYAFADDSARLGRSPWADENVANASYNEVRIWNGALSQDQLEFLHELGPDHLEP